MERVSKQPHRYKNSERSTKRTKERANEKQTKIYLHSTTNILFYKIYIHNTIYNTIYIYVYIIQYASHYIKCTGVQ